jgi:sucrose phosphorylase
MPDGHSKTIHRLLRQLYGADEGPRTADRLIARMDRFNRETHRKLPPPEAEFSERDVVLITYADMLSADDMLPLDSLRQFVGTWLRDLVDIIHILPFFPSSSDAGFSIIDYESVDPALGSWASIDALKADGLRLMVDAVINHVSAESAWFQGFKEGDPIYEDYFIRLDPKADLSAITRPRAHRLLTAVETVRGTEHVWTTFSPDQIDLNYGNPDTLLDVIDVLLSYIEHGAAILRLDAVAYLWKEMGTSCIHLPQAHWIVQLFRAVIDEVAPGVAILTETNVPHPDNVSYFGDGSDEAHLVYNFTLPPLTAHAVLSGSAQHLTEWAGTLRTPSPTTAFLNFTASHDGIGLMPVKGILADDEIELLVTKTQSGGGVISSKSNADGSTSPYELNISYFDLLNGARPEDPQSLCVDRFMVSQAVMLAMAGLPAIYLHSLLGSRNFHQGVEQTGLARSINREKLKMVKIEQELGDAGHLRRAVFVSYRRLIAARIREPAFHPGSAQRILRLDERVFAIQRTDEATHRALLALHNVSAVTVPLSVPVEGVGAGWRDLIDGRTHQARAGSLSLEVPPYGVAWLKNVP